MGPRIQVKSVEVSLATVLESGCGAVYDHWNELRGGRFAPSWREFDLMALPPRAIPYLHVVDVNSEPPLFVFRFWGTGLVTLLGLERTGQDLLAPHDSPLNEERRLEVARDYQRVIASRQPFAFVWDASSARNVGYSVVVPSLRLPLSEDGERVTQIVTCFDFSTARREQWQRLMAD